MTLTNVRAFMDRMDMLALKAFYRTKDALTAIEGGNYTFSQSLLDSLTGIDDVLGAMRPFPTSLAFLTVDLAGTGGQTSTGFIQLPTIPLAVQATPLQALTNISAVSIPMGNVALNLNGSVLQVQVAVPAGQPADTYNGPVTDGAGGTVAMVVIQVS